MSGTAEAQERSRRRRLIEAAVGGAAFFAISILSRFVPFALHLMVLAGLALPIGWGVFTHTWAEMGFTRRRMGAGLAWGLGAGVVTSLIGCLSVKERVLPPSLGQELALGVPLWLLVASPFQEFIFRGWLQPRLKSALGKGWGLLASTALFVIWHYCWPLAEQSAFPLNTLWGLAATCTTGLIYGWVFQRTGNIAAPWLGHALAGIAFLCIGAGSFRSALP